MDSMYIHSGFNLLMFVNTWYLLQRRQILDRGTMQKMEVFVTYGDINRPL